MLPMIQAVIAEAQEVSVGKSRIKIMESEYQTHKFNGRMKRESHTRRAHSKVLEKPARYGA